MNAGTSVLVAYRQEA